MILGDNTSAVNWIFRASLPTRSIYFATINFIARKVARAVSASKNFIVSRHVPGKRNVVCDLLSFEGKDRVSKRKVIVNNTTTFIEKIATNPVAHDCPPNDVVTHRLVSSFPQLVPKGFKISHLPTEVLSFAQEAVAMLESSITRAQKEEMKKSIDTGDDGADFATTISTAKNPALREYPHTSNASFCEHSLRFTESQDLINQEKLLESIGKGWRDKLLEKPSARWQRRTSTVTGGVPFTDREILLKDYIPKLTNS